MSRWMLFWECLWCKKKFKTIANYGEPIEEKEMQFLFTEKPARATKHRCAPGLSGRAVFFGMREATKGEIPDG